MTYKLNYTRPGKDGVAKSTRETYAAIVIVTNSRQLGGATSRCNSVPTSALNGHDYVNFTPTSDTGVTFWVAVFSPPASH